MGDIHAGSGDDASGERLATAACVEAMTAAMSGWASCAWRSGERGSRTTMNTASATITAAPASTGLDIHCHRSAFAPDSALMRRIIV